MLEMEAFGSVQDLIHASISARGGRSTLAQVNREMLVGELDWFTGVLCARPQEQARLVCGIAFPRVPTKVNRGVNLTLSPVRADLSALSQPRPDRVQALGRFPAHHAQ